MKITTDVLDRLINDDDYEDWMEEEEHRQKTRRNKSMKTTQRGDAKKQGRRRIQEARSAKLRETFEYNTED